ncbi:hypothetical protein Y032_0139g2148 [Ancylostoma ceylanicum]|uniref:GIY-YIG domain-containing protein n=1 Tax=Ancylostoma ceylanicum TaxID=53326 RepID=A0A016T4J5_9BILA|nr:hypothetical protein Y032_0139g2148 [Ancylostoma ceylanicum]
MDECFNILNQQSQYIKLTRETPNDGWLAYLNTQIHLSNGLIKVKWYRKASAKNIIVHAESAHPTAVKRAVVRNMFKTANQVCTGEAERQESLRLARHIAKSDGYTTPQRPRKRPVTNSNISNANKLPLCLPFVSDEATAELRRCLVRAQLQNDVILVNIPNDNIKNKQLVRNRLYDRQCITTNCVVCPYGKDGDCSQTGVIYEVKCLTCNALYIGETGRVLSVRIKEHLASKRHGSLVSALGKHRHDEHDGADFDVMCTILAYEPEISARKLLEAFWISVRNPKMNNRNECLAITI